MPTISVSLSAADYELIQDEVEKQVKITGKKNVSEAVGALVRSSAIITEETEDYIKNYMYKEGKQRQETINNLIKLGHNYFYVIKPELNIQG